MSDPILSRAMADYMAGNHATDELTGGIASTLPATLSSAGKKWSVIHDGKETAIAGATVDVVIVRAMPAISRAYYDGAYDPNALPACWSEDGVAPRRDVTKRQHPTCAGCPMNKPAGDGKVLCGKNRRLALVSANDIDATRFDGPLVYRVSESSLRKLYDYGTALTEAGYAPYAVVTRMAFDPTVTWPRITFDPYRALTEDEANRVIAMREDDPRVSRILSHADEYRPGISTAPTLPTRPGAFFLASDEQPEAPRIEAPAPEPTPEPIAEAPATIMASPEPEAAPEPAAALQATPAPAPVVGAAPQQTQSVHRPLPPRPGVPRPGRMVPPPAPSTTASPVPSFLQGAPAKVDTAPAAAPEPKAAAPSMAAEDALAKAVTGVSKFDEALGASLDDLM